MKVVLLNDTSGHMNWGCQATSSGLKQRLRANWPGATLTCQAADKLPFAGQLFRRQWINSRVRKAILAPQNPHKLISALTSYRFNPSIFLDADVVILNGEGMIHKDSGHFFRLLGIMAAAKRSGAKTAAINQSVDVDVASPMAELLSTVYGGLDAVHVRDTKSLDLVRALNIDSVKLVPDAAFATPVPEPTFIANTTRKLALEPKFIVMTGSSSLNRHTTHQFDEIFTRVSETFEMPVAVLASTKTDLRLGQALKDKGRDLHLISAETPLDEVVAVISAAQALIGGRFHPMIFAALCGTPFIGFAGNTHKTAGLVDLLNYPIAQIEWQDLSAFAAALDRLKKGREELANILKVNANTRASEFLNMRLLE